MPVKAVCKIEDKLKEFIFDLGRRKAILVEGPTDALVLNEWYSKNQKDILFYPAGGCEVVKNWLVLLEQIGAKVWGIIDRDYIDEKIVERSLTSSSSCLFILTRHSIENYLLEPIVVFQGLKIGCGEKLKLDNHFEMEAEILKICKSLKTVMAANWVFSEAARNEQLSPTHFKESENANNRLEIIERSEKKLKEIEKTEVKKRIEEKESQIESKLSNLFTAHQVINGKHLLYQITQIFKPQFHGKEVLFRYLSTHVEVPADIRFIVEQKILGLPAQPSS